MLIPVSLLASYRYCSRKVFLQQVLGMREPARPELLVGTVRHGVLERFSAYERDVIVRIARGSTFEEIERSFIEVYEHLIREEIARRKDGLYALALDPSEVYEASKRSYRADARFRAELIAAFMTDRDVEHEELYETLTPKILPEQRFSSKELGITGIIDRILLYPNEAVPFEFKTGSAPHDGMWPGHKIQLGAYLLLARTAYPVKRGIVRYLDAERDAGLRYTPFVRREIEQLIAEIRSVLEGSELPRKVEQVSKCARCGVRDRCYSESAVTAAMVERFGKDAVIR